MSIALAHEAHVDTCEQVGGVTATFWREGASPEPVAPDTPLSDEGVLCLTVDPAASAARAYEVLRPICGPQLTFDMVDDLLNMDKLPLVRDYGTDARVRKVSAFGVKPVDAPTRTGDQVGRAGRLSFELIEFLANDSWLVLCCHEAESFAGPDSCTLGRGDGCAPVVDAVARRWAMGGSRTPGDLGVLMLHELTATYARATTALISWLEHWELRFYQSNLEDRETLINLRGLAGEFRSRLNALNRQPDVAGDRWFARLTDSSLSDQSDMRILRSVEALDRLGDMLRGSFELLQSQAMAEQLRLQHIQADRTERLQAKIETITSVFLVPSLIAAFFGANTALPGGNGTHEWLSFELMVGTMILGAVGVFLALRWIRTRERAGLAELGR